VKEVPELPRLDAVKPVILRNNRWRCDHGWDIDLDDGSSNYLITNNLCLHGGIKNREGYGRLVENNIMVGGSLNPHVWFAESGDIFRHNIVWTAYRPALMHRPPWGQEMDYNLMQKEGTETSPATALQRQSGRDEHSIVADAQFMDPARGDYRVKDGSPALALGFLNFGMDQFGVQKPALRAIARTPVLLGPTQAAATIAARDTTPRDIAPRGWLGVKVRNIADEGEMSAFGLPGVTGVLILEVPSDSPPMKAGLKKNDVILSVNGAKTADVASLLQLAPSLTAGQTLSVGVSRDQKVITLLFEQLK
jgi:hypothetical protein